VISDETSYQILKCYPQRNMVNYEFFKYLLARNSEVGRCDG
jgi:hypothetical protein